MNSHMENKVLKVFARRHVEDEKFIGLYEEIQGMKKFVNYYQGAHGK